MAKEANIKKIVIELSDGKEIEMSTQDAKKLFAVLKELYGEKEVVRDRPYPVPQPYPVPDPFVPWRRPWVWPYNRPYWQIKCSDGTADLSLKGTTMLCSLK